LAILLRSLLGVNGLEFFINLTPLIIPLSLKRRGGKVFYRIGANAPLKHPIELGLLSKEGRIKRGGRSPPLKLLPPSPEGKGDKGG